MKNRSTTFIIILSVLACFGLVFGEASPAAPDSFVASNTFDGASALANVTTGGFNTADGWFSQWLLTDAFFNTGDGAGTLAISDGSNNTAVGAGAMLTNFTGFSNVAVGVDALVLNSVAFNNNAVGLWALFNNDSSVLGLANFNNAHGNSALFANVDGSQNNAFGDLALTSNIAGSFNTAVGDDALDNSTGNSNTAVGDEAGSALFTGEGNIYIGAQQTGVDGDLEFIRIGNDTAFAFPYDTFIAGIFGRAVSAATAVPVFVDDTGKLGTVLVDAVGNKMATPHAMLNESLNQQKRIAELEGTVARLAVMVKEQAAQIQKVSAQLEMQKPATKVVVNKP